MPVKGGKSPAVLFVHVPRITGRRREIMVMPQGIIPLAGIVADHGIQVRIAHTGLGGLHRDEALRCHAAACRPATVLFALHWHQQAAAAVRVMNLFAHWFPATPLVAGGLTASFFARELMDLAPGLSAVIRGDGEAAVAAIARRLVTGRPPAFARVPNAVWRDPNGVLRDNGISFVLSPRGAARLEHARFEVLSHPRAYLDTRLYADFHDPPKGISPHAYGPAFHYNPGRGCTYGCVFCGGSRASQMRTCRRTGYFFYGARKVLRDLAAARTWGLDTWRVSFDPGRRRTEWTALFRSIERAGMRWRVVFDAWTPPPADMIAALARVTRPGSVLVLSPETGNEALRLRLKGFAHTDARYDHAISTARAHGLGVHLFFSAGLPGEIASDVDRTASMIRRLRRAHRVEATACPMELDPASPIFIHPERHGIRLLRRHLSDFMDMEHRVGYETPSFKESKILASIRRLQEEAAAS